MDRSELCVIVPYSNPANYVCRAKLTDNFIRYLESQQIQYVLACVWYDGSLHTPVTLARNGISRVAYGQFVCHVSGVDVLWHKENIINIVEGKLGEHIKYLAWVDSDLMFLDHKWPEKTIEALQRYKVVQLFSHCIELGPEGEVIDKHTGFGYSLAKDIPIPEDDRHRPEGSVWHPGFGWAMRRDTFQALGGLLDTCIVGGGDYMMAWGMLSGECKLPIGGLPEAYVATTNNWAYKAYQYIIDYDIGYVPQTIIHQWHGKKRNRQYKERYQILKDCHFNPAVDLVKDENGLYRFAGHITEGIKQDIVAYFKSRDEDSMEA